MPNIAALLKEEITRLARREVRHEMDALKKAVAVHRTQISELRRELRAHEKALRHVRKEASKPVLPTVDEESTQKLRFSPARLAAQRKRLSLSAEVFGKLVGTTGQTIYLWERGKTRPNAQNLAAIAALRGVGKRELAARLAALG
jgi:DNA-binding transcriptional regulator YiaG